jgi:hypothetical protein
VRGHLASVFPPDSVPDFHVDGRDCLETVAVGGARHGGLEVV